MCSSDLIAKRLKASPDDVAVGVLEVAVLYNTSVERVYQCTSPAKIREGKVTLSLPPLLLANGRRKLWRLGDLLEGLRAKGYAASGDKEPQAEAKASSSSGTAKAARLGRPRAS